MILFYLLLLTVFVFFVIYDRYLSIQIEKEHARYNVHLMINNLLSIYDEEIGNSSDFPILGYKMNNLYNFIKNQQSIDFKSFRVDRKSLIAIIKNTDKKIIMQLDKEMKTLSSLGKYDYFSDIIKINEELSRFSNPIANTLCNTRDNIQKFFLDSIVRFFEFTTSRKNKKIKNNRADHIYENRELLT